MEQKPDASDPKEQSESGEDSLLPKNVIVVQYSRQLLVVREPAAGEEQQVNGEELFQKWKKEFNIEKCVISKRDGKIMMNTSKLVERLQWLDDMFGGF